MKTCNSLKTIVIGLAFSCVTGISAHAEETNLEKVETSKNKAVDSVKSTYRDGKDQTCEMVNGKMKCVANKIGHKAKNLSDKVKTKAKDVEHKVD